MVLYVKTIRGDKGRECSTRSVKRSDLLENEEDYDNYEEEDEEEEEEETLEVVVVVVEVEEVVVHGTAAVEDNGRGRERVMAPANLAAARGRRRLRFWAAKHKVERPRRCSNRDVTGREKENARERERRKERDSPPRENVSRAVGLYTPLPLFLPSRRRGRDGSKRGAHSFRYARMEGREVYSFVTGKMMGRKG
ncbi:hypothetical protein DBV15_07298 [Temnothorax longispinosus]|uniref:Uncharacterized protein n=1 Tax=Temnothorax longispinosus TaxID=300112 RepID=A0A4S2KNH3_9HYME|nr:hypothetical protein DBV15_07298 [Temnothorax longispinosus]